MAPVHWAPAGPHPEFARLLIEAGADVNTRRQGGFTPLHEVAMAGYGALAAPLLANGADPQARDTQGRMPLTLAPDL